MSEVTGLRIEYIDKRCGKTQLVESNGEILIPEGSDLTVKEDEDDKPYKVRRYYQKKNRGRVYKLGEGLLSKDDGETH